MKTIKHLLVLCAAVVLFATLLVGCGDSDPKPELEFELNADGESYSVVRIVYKYADDGVINLYANTIGMAADEEIVIPAEYKGKPVTGIGDSAFRSQANLESITIPDSVTSIGDFAFFGCYGLKSLTIPAGVTSIGEGAFGGGSFYLDYNTYGSTDGNVSLYPILSSVMDITVAEGNPVYHEEGNCLIETASKTLIAGFADSVIPTDGSVTHIGDYAFASCGGLANITIPGVEINKTYGFSTIPGNATISGSMSYGGASVGTTSITLPSCIVSIGANAFSNCSDLVTVMIPDSVIRIGDGAFRGCSELTSITVNENNTTYHSSENCLIETASKTLIAGCKNSEIPSDGSVTVIGESAFQDCIAIDYLSNINNYRNSEGDHTVIRVNVIKVITIPDSITKIGKDAFFGCDALVSITIGRGVTGIGEGAFHGCTELTSITVNENNTTYHSSGNCLIETASKTLIAGCMNSVIPSDGSVAVIGESAFYDCLDINYHYAPATATEEEYESFIRKSMKSLAIPDSVTEIGKDAFRNCDALENITIGSGVTIIGESAFSGCYCLTSLTIPDSVTSIGNSAFSSCSDLTSITFTGTMAQWQAIEKGDEWNDIHTISEMIGSNYKVASLTIHCTDGDITEDND